jgi:predicted TIM-barrel fold metal-dependent hydrolase
MRIDACCHVGIDREFDLTAERLLQQMDAAGVDMTVIMPPLRFYAVRNQEGNDQLLQAARRHPDRLLATCTATPWLGAEALQIVDRAAAGGARLLTLHPFVQGFDIDDEIVFPLIEEARRLRLAVYVHSGHPGGATPLQMALLALRYPDVFFIMGHCGATDYWPDVAIAAQLAPHLYLEGSLAKPYVFAAHLRKVGISRGVMGSAAPLNDLVFEWQQAESVFSAEDRERVFGGTLQVLLSIQAARS